MGLVRHVPVRASIWSATIVAAVCLALVWCTGARAAGCPDVDASPATVGTQRAVAAVGCLVNHERAAAGLGPVRIDSRVSAVAQRFAADMVAGGFFSHVSPSGDDAGTRLLSAGLDWLAFGENLARGQSTPREAMRAWLASPDHCVTLMTPMFTSAGFGIAASSSGPYWVQEFVRPVGLGGMTRFVPTPSCPRTPAPFTAADPAPAPAAAAVPRVRPATVSRSGRVLRARLVLTGPAGRMAVRVQVRQGGRTVRSVTLRRAAGVVRLRLRLAQAGPGTLTVRAASGRAVSRRFR